MTEANYLLPAGHYNQSMSYVKNLSLLNTDRRDEVLSEVLNLCCSLLILGPKAEQVVLTLAKEL